MQDQVLPAYDMQSQLGALARVALYFWVFLQQMGAGEIKQFLYKIKNHN